MQRGWSIAVVTWFVGLIPSVCVAAPPAESMAAEPDVRGANEARRWYGWQIFTADLTAGALFLGAVADDHNSALFGLSGFSFGLGGPTIHAAHGRWDVALGSLGLRVLGPGVGAVIGVQADTPRAVSDSGGENTAGRWALTGVAIGGLVASALDGLLLSYDTPPSSPNAGRARNQLLRMESLPQLLVLQQGLGLGYSGQF